VTSDPGAVREHLLTANLSREETQALLLDADPRAEARAADVSPRDFKLPHRLSREERGRLAGVVEAALPALERALAPWLREGLTLELDQVTEVRALALFEELEEPFVVQTLGSRGQQGWILVANGGARALARVALGVPDSMAEEPLARALSPIEAALVGDMLLEVGGGVARALGLELEAGALLQELRPLRLSLGGDLARDGQRIGLHVTLSGAAVPTTTLRVYLPCAPRPARPREQRKPARPLPPHLGSVPVEVSAQLGSIDLPLCDLLALEVGDVVPLGVGEGEGTTVFVEGQACGRALWGSHEGGLALRILNFQPPDED
jgi:flagellar motor switch protein FliM